jgi:hypothetical protein
VSQDLVEGRTAALQWPKPVISRVEPVEGHGAPDLAGRPGERGLRCEGVARAADEQGRTADPGEVLVATPLRLPHRLERVAEQEQPEGGQGVFGVAGDHRADAPPHRTATQDEPLGRQTGATSEHRGRLPCRRFEDGRAIWCPATGAPIRVVESKRRDACIGERVGDHNQRWRPPAGTGAVREQNAAISARPWALEVDLERRRGGHAGHRRRRPGGGAQPAGK